MALIDTIDALLPSSSDLTAAELRTAFAELILGLHPVGTILHRIDSTNPGTIYGGTWVRLAEGTMLISQDSGDSDFDTARETGGSKEVTLSAAQSGLPAHAHDMLRFPTTTGGSSGFTADTSMSGTPTAVTLDTNGVVGGAQPASQAHSILNPYTVVYIWERTA